MAVTRYAIAALAGLSFAATAAAQDQGMPEKPQGLVVTPEKAYVYGAAQGKSVRAMLVSDEGEPLVDLEIFAAAYKEALNTPGLELSPDIRKAGEAANHKAATELRDRRAAAWDAAVKKNRTEGDAWIAGLRGQPGVIATSSGLLYKVIERGTGTKPTPTDRIRMTFEEYTIDGELTLSTARGDMSEHNMFGLIPGLKEGLQLMPTGSTFEFYLSPDLGYGLRTHTKIGPDGGVRYMVTLEEIL